jgi:hypothetical protein
MYEESATAPLNFQRANGAFGYYDLRALDKTKSALHGILPKCIAGVARGKTQALSQPSLARSRFVAPLRTSRFLLA